MKHIFVDLEMHPVAKEFREERRICSREIMEIGAVMLDDDYKEISSFKSYVRPEFVTDIYTRISVLTGINKEMLLGADVFNIVFDKFVSWCGVYGYDYKIYAWSGSDLSQLTKEMKLKNTIVTREVEMMLQNWEDFQKEYCELIEIDKLISLDKALSTIGQCFLGNMHDALYDARNTADLFAMSQDRDKFHRMLQPITEALRPTERLTFILGDIFNFDILETDLA